jgi:hypothetical protein
VTPESEHLRPHWQVTVGTLTLIIDAKDQVPQAGLTIERQLVVEILGSPEADDLEEPALGSLAAMLQHEVWEDESIACWHRLRFTNDLPIPRCATELTGEPLLDLAVVGAWFTRRKDGITSGHAQGHSSVAQNTVGA